MKAIVQHGYGFPADVLALRDIETPTIGDDEVLIRARAASVHPDVWHVVEGRPYVLRAMGSGLRAPTAVVPGTDVAGVVEEIGSSVTRFRPGDAVFGETVRGYQWKNGGAFAEYVAAPESSLVTKPDTVTFEQAASVPTSGLIAIANLEQGRLAAGRRVLINGAGGGVGMLAVQIAKARGAEVTGVDRTDKLDLLRELGADHVIDYTDEDFTRSDMRYDLIFDIPGNHSLRECLRALEPDGTYVLIGHDGFGATSGRWLGSVPRMLALMARSLVERQLPNPSFAMPDKQQSLTLLAELMTSGRITPLIDRTYPLGEAPQAIQHLASGRAHGRLVITM